jgi:NTE family protein
LVLIKSFSKKYLLSCDLVVKNLLHQAPRARNGMYNRNIFHLVKAFVIFFFIVSLTACMAVKPNIVIPAKQPAALPLKQNPQVILVLGSGGARGYAHIGIIKVLQNAGIPIDMIVGASAGSVMGAIYADNGNANALEHTMLHTSFGDFVDISLVPNLQGPITGNQFQDFLLKNMHARNFEDLKIRLVTVATDLTTGRAYPIASGPIAPAVASSAAIPGLVSPFNLYGHTLVDGGVIDPVPVDVARSYHPKVIIAVDLVSNLSDGLPATAYGIFYRSYAISWNKLDVLSAQGADVIIHPNVGDTSMFDISKKQALFTAGEIAAEQSLPQIRKLLALHHIKLRSIQNE